MRSLQPTVALQPDALYHAEEKRLYITSHSCRFCGGGFMTSLGEFLAECALLYKNRQNVYNDAWRYMSVADLTAGLRLKVARIEAMLIAKSSIKKVLDDLRDVVVYAYFIHEKLNNSVSDALESADRRDV